MRIIKVNNYEEVSERAAMLIAAQVILKPDAVLGLATGSTPLGTYHRLIDWYRAGRLDFSEVTSVNLDEYVGIDGRNPQSYRYFMEENFFSHINIERERTYVPNGMAENYEEECRAYDANIRGLGGIDLQLLGIGNNGHIGFNEPAEIFTQETHVVDLEESTIQANTRFFASEKEVPGQALTMGMGEIMHAKKVLLIANGAKKAQIIEKAFSGPITPQIPASILKLHGDCTIIYCG